jgi:aspartokinase-like uncharacterized kinase
VAITWVVKLGGSLARSEHLPPWLDALAAAPGTVIVPGGGPFADQVRALQGRWRFDDAAAHAMAILAMAQYGTLLAALEPRLKTSSDPHALRAAAAAGAALVWLPDPAALPADEIPAGWDVTSDSLAAWLAGRIGARQLLLVKSAPLPEAAVSVAALPALGLVDPSFPRFAAASGVDVWLAGAASHGEFPAGLERPEGRLKRADGGAACA